MQSHATAKQACWLMMALCLLSSSPPGEAAEKPESRVVRLRSVAKVDPARLARLLADLDADQFTTRQQATEQLLAIGAPALPELRKLLKSNPPVEVVKRVEALVDTREERSRIPSAEQRFGFRAVRVLEQADTPEARQTLKELADGDDQARLTREARAALDRLRKAEPEAEGR